MASKIYESTYRILQSTKHRVNENIQPILFPTDTELNDTEYWLFSDLYNLFGESYVGKHDNIMDTVLENIHPTDFKSVYPQTPNGIAQPKTFESFYTDHAVKINHDYIINSIFGNTLRKNGPDAKLTRYACWKILQPWGRMIFAQLYFMNPGIKFTELYNMSYKFARIYQRNALTQSNKIINGIAHRNNANMRQFNNMLHRAFFYTSDINTIKDYYNIRGKIYDYMGVHSLLARRNALNRAISKLDENPNMNFNKFTEILYTELINNRVKMIQQTNRPPEQDISQKSISQLTGELKKMERKFINKFAKQSLR